MPPYIDAPYRTTARFSRRKLIVVAVIFVGILAGSRSAVSAFVDFLWFQSLGQGSVFTRSLMIQCAVFMSCTVATFCILYAAFALIRKSNETDLQAKHAIVLGNVSINIPSAAILRVLSVLGAGVVALISGTTMLSDWPTFVLFFSSRVSSTAQVDTILGKPLHFFLFTLPALHLVIDWLMTLAIACVVVAVVFLLLTSGARALHKNVVPTRLSPFRGLSTSAAFLLFALRWSYS